MPRPAPRITVAIAAALLGFLSVLAARQPPSAGRELRRLELVDLIRDQDARVRRLRTEVRSLEGDLAAESEATEVQRLRRRVAATAARVGGGRVEGPGVVVTLDDSPARRSPTGDPNDLVVHERDLQTVVNALWGAGAEAVGINGERLTSTSAVRCAGNTLLLHGTLHSPPYLVAAIGDPAALEAVGRQPGVAQLSSAARDLGLVFEVERAVVRIGLGTSPSPVMLARPVEAA
ncbi:MAG TPA: DUF881 domain-containing protein [Actinomycetota bacterium]|nr:DUF881 domain-containing protein [Actinomycetota bacterium]